MALVKPLYCAAMLVTFKCKEAADITMFGDVAIKLIKIMGYTGDVPGAIAADEVRDALARLERAVETDRQAASADNDDEEVVVSLHQRALPLVEMLRLAAAGDSPVMWDN